MIIIDRIEGDYAVLEVAGEHIDFPVSALPEGASEGVTLTLAIAPAPSRMEEAQARLDALRRGDADTDLIRL